MLIFYKVLAPLYFPHIFLVCEVPGMILGSDNLCTCPENTYLQTLPDGTTECTNQLVETTAQPQTGTQRNTECGKCDRTKLIDLLHVHAYSQINFSCDCSLSSNVVLEVPLSGSI